jgi:helicase SWR1
MDRAHRIGQVRDVRVFKMVSEKTVEENILRRALQKSLLDRAVIQEGHFTTDYHSQKEKKVEAEEGEGDVQMAIERFLEGNGGEKGTEKVLESVEDKEDVAAAQSARKEEHQDEVDFAERSSKGPSRAQTPRMLKGAGDGGDESGDDEDGKEGHVDSYMIRQMERLVAEVPFVPPLKPAGRKDKNGRDRSHRPKRKR